MANTTLTILQILELSELTPYQVYRLWQDAIDQNGIDRQLKPQMCYNYDRNGLIVHGRKASETGQAGRYTVTEAYTFIARWMKKNYNITLNTEPKPSTTDSTEVDGQLEMFEV